MELNVLFHHSLETILIQTSNCLKIDHMLGNMTTNGDMLTPSALSKCPQRVAGGLTDVSSRNAAAPLEPPRSTPVVSSSPLIIKARSLQRSPLGLSGLVLRCISPRVLGFLEDTAVV